MKENHFNNSLANINEAFDNVTFRYRINGFAEACRMDGLFPPKKAGVIFSTPDTSNLSDNEYKHSYFISAGENQEAYGKSITLNGQYDELFFTFINVYNKERLDTRIVDLPFYISLEKKIDENTFKITMETIAKQRTKFTLSKSCEFQDRTISNNIVFYANIMDFSTILKIVKSFVYNPCLVYNNYNEMMTKQKVVFTSSMVDKAAMQDENLDKPIGPIGKIFKKIIG